MASGSVGTSVFKIRLAAITQTNHWNEAGVILAYEPYVREMRVWADLFGQVEIFTPLTTAPGQGSLCPYNRDNVTFTFVQYNTQISRWGFLIRFFQLPVVLFKMAAFIWRQDFLLIRSPGHFSFVAHVLALLMRKKSITKFAGLFDYFKGERLPSIAERFFMRHFLFNRHIVLVYGKSIRKNFISFFPLLFSEEEMKQLEATEVHRPADGVFRFYSLGRLIKVKGYDLAIRGLGELCKLAPDWNWHYHLIGDGPEHSNLLALATELGIDNRITFEGKQTYLDAMRMIKGADAVIMPGVMEGWPKVVIEAWLTGTLPVCARAGLLPQVVQQAENGFLFDANPHSLAETCLQLRDLTKERRHAMVVNGKSYARQLSADSFKKGIEYICKQQLGLG